MNPTKEQAFDKISALVERFREHLEEYKRGAYNEHQTRVDYINPFFKALGWDMDNEQGHAEAYREVIHEDKVKVGGATKAPDYAFTLYGQRKFFVDAKKPGVNIKGDIAPAYQVRRYGWSAKVPLSVVTDFEEFAIYDCTKKPNPGDKPSVSRIKYMTFDQYLDEFDFLWDIFAKENLPKGRFDKYVRSDTGKKGTATVDEEFLKSIEQWRTYLATSIALRNKSLSVDELNYAVQKTIDRIIFLRMCEDRGVEKYGLLRLAAEKGEVYANLFALFQTADAKYNSGLFDFKEDRITRELVIDNKVLKTIIGELYYPKCEYEFSVMPADILGSVYERFLGKTIRLTAGHQAKVEEKPEVRKAGGVYYTPKYIVDYIVENTLGKLLEGKTPKDVEKLRICDPACGSGSFLIGAYQYLLDWHLIYYTEQSPPPRVGRGPGGGAITPDGNLTTALKKRILLNNIYGVDIDPQAVEVTKLNLLLKALEGETQASINQQMTLFHERVLPNLSHNIQCGNSLIGPDFYDNQFDLFTDQMKKINAFDWHRAFPEVFRDGGFDAVIGNPPYIQLSMFEWFEQSQKTYMLNRYCSSMGRLNTFGFFIEKGINLLNNNGIIGYIIPNTILTQEYYQTLRKHILDKTSIQEIISYSNMVFADAVVETITLLLTNQSVGNNIIITNYNSPLDYTHKEIDKKVFLNAYQYQFLVKVDTENLGVRNTFNITGLKIGDIADINQAIALKKDRAAYIFRSKDGNNYKPLLDGRDINRYSLNWPGNYLKYDVNAIHSCKREDIFLSNEKVFFRRVSANLIATLDTDQYYALNTLIAVNLKPNVEINIRYLLALFNSKAVNWYYNKFFKSTKKVFSEIQARSVAQIPIPKIDFSDSRLKDTHDTIVKLVNNVIDLNKQVIRTSLPSQRQQLQRAIDHAERRIDELVYELYGLTAEEVAIVEGR